MRRSRRNGEPLRRVRKIQHLPQIELCVVAEARRIERGGIPVAQDGKLEILVERNLKQAFVDTELALDYFVQKNGILHDTSGIYKHVLKRCNTLMDDLSAKI